MCRSELGLVHFVSPALLRALSAKVFVYLESQKAANRKEKRGIVLHLLCAQELLRTLRV